MASIINASSSGSGGIVQTADASGVLQLQTNGTVALNVDTNANIGIGTTSPANILTVQTAATGTTPGSNVIARLQSNAAGRDATLQFSDNVANSSTISMVGGSTIFRQNGTESMRMLNSGAILSLAGGSTTATGTGIAFPASQSASSDANTLDDYEEGTWTPVYAAVSGSMTYSQQVGTYTKIGRLVTVYCHVITTANNALSGTLQLNNLPFTSSSAANYCVGPMHLEGANIQANVWAWGYVAPGTQTVYFRYWANNSGAATIVGSQLNANSDMMWSASYFV